MAKKSKKSFTVTFGYRAVITVEVKADIPEEANEIATKDFEAKFRLPGASNINIEDDSYRLTGTLNNTDSWLMIDQE